MVQKRGHGLETIFAPNQVAQEPGGMQVNLLPELAMVNKSAWVDNGWTCHHPEPASIYTFCTFVFESEKLSFVILLVETLNRERLSKQFSFASTIS